MSERQAVWSVDASAAENDVVVTGMVQPGQRPRSWGRRRWQEVIEGRGRGPRVELREARVELFCRCGALVIISDWNGVEWCSSCGQCYRLSCAVKMEVFDE